ncbi:MAG: hypothetical protein R3C61_18150 [Bacteroidia bacterium]
MYYNNSSPLSWQTNVLTFRNQSMRDVRKMLENQYGSEIYMYHDMFLVQPFAALGDAEGAKLDEIKLVLYLQYEPASGQMVVRGLVKN